MNALQLGYDSRYPFVLRLLLPTVHRPSDTGLMFHGCDAVSGDSGSPILGLSGDALVVLGVHIATVRRENRESLGIAIPIDPVAESENPTP